MYFVFGSVSWEKGEKKIGRESVCIVLYCTYDMYIKQICNNNNTS